MKFLRKKIIKGCESRGDSQSDYLTRLTILEPKSRNWAIYLHKFHRSDSPEHHDHPWSFVSVILWRGYFEETPGPLEARVFHTTHDDYARSIAGLSSIPRAATSFLETHPFDNGIKTIPGEWGAYEAYGSAPIRKRVWPGMVLFRPATWRHRVVLISEKPSITLVFRWRYEREWGFFTAKGWQHWKDYFRERGCE